MEWLKGKMGMTYIQTIWKYRGMIYCLVKRDLKIRYKGSILGFFWMLLNPLLQLCIYTIVFSVIIKMNIDRFYLFLFVTLVPWIFFSTCLSYGSQVILSEKDLIKKTYFPREVLPISFTMSQFINMLLSFMAIFAVILLSGKGISLSALSRLPGIMIIEFFMALGIVYFTSSITVYFRDLEHITSILALAWMYMTPILYPIEYVPEELRKFVYFNPMTSVTIAYRDILYYGNAPKTGTMLNAALMGIVFWLAGKICFCILQRGYAREL